MKIKLIGAAVGSIALLIGVGVDVAHAGTYPSGGTYHDGGVGSPVEPQPDPTTLATASFAPAITAEAPCGAVIWGGGCG